MLILWVLNPQLNLQDNPMEEEVLFEMKLIVKEDVSSRTTLSSSSFIYCKLSSLVHRKIIYAMTNPSKNHNNR